MLALPSEPDPIAKLGWILLQKRWISTIQLQAALQTQSHQLPAQRLGELLLEQAVLSESQLEAALQEQHWRRQGYWVI